ncbi:MAG: hypothetical protein ABI871_03920 [Chthoniobacterales bacterium]
MSISHGLGLPIERNSEWRTLWWAIAASVLVHLLIAYSLAAFGRGRAIEPIPDEEKPAELTLLDLSPVAPPAPKAKNPLYMETDPAKESAEKPKEQTFESNANSVAAGKLPAGGDAPLPSQEGKDRPFTELETHSYSLPTEGVKPQPQSKAPAPEVKAAVAPPARPKASEMPRPTPAIAPTAAPEQFAMLTATPPPAMSPPDETRASPTQEFAPAAQPSVARPQPERPPSAYQAQREQTRISGRISDRGPSAVNAVGTPLGRYQKSVSDAIGSRWYFYMGSKIDLVSIGTAHVEGEVDAEGRVQKLRILSNSANEAFANICLQSFQEAHIPPIPPDLVATLPEGKMPVDFYFTTYANR